MIHFYSIIVYVCFLSLLDNGQVENFNFNGYPAPTLGLLIKICTSVETWLSADPDNVAVVHCYVLIYSRFNHRMEKLVR